MINDLVLLAGNDIPFEEAQISIHQPTLKEIGYIGEETFFSGYQVINVSKNLLDTEGKVDLENTTDFDILIAILRERNAVMQKNRNCVIMFLTLLFPQYIISFEKDCILLKNSQDESEQHKINNTNFEKFKSILKQIVSLGNEVEDAANPSGEMAKKIAEKLRKRHQILSEQGKESQKVDIITRYASVLAVGMNLNLNNVMNLTMFQLFDQFQRYQLKLAYDIYIKAKMAGAKDLKEVEDWMKDLHP